MTDKPIGDFPITDAARGVPSDKLTAFEGQTVTNKDPTCESQSPTNPFARSNEKFSNTQLRLKQEHAELLGALKSMTLHYVGLALSGDCGFWDPELEDEVIKARELIAKVEK